jgi:hypothetical protein
MRRGIPTQCVLSYPVTRSRQMSPSPSPSPPAKIMVRPQVRPHSSAHKRACALTPVCHAMSPGLQFGEPPGSLYTVLGVSRNATATQLRAAFRAAARDSHPDKGGDAHVFAAVRHAYEVAFARGAVPWAGLHTNSRVTSCLSPRLSRRCQTQLPASPTTTWALTPSLSCALTHLLTREPERGWTAHPALTFVTPPWRARARYEAGVSQRSDTGIGSLLDELERLGLAVEPGCQLVCVCELCGRPSTKDCFVCTLRYCEFCTRKQHWKARGVELAGASGSTASQFSRG